MLTASTPNMPRFRVDAATEMVGLFLQSLGGTADWLTILKLMYHVERRALDRYGWPVFFDRMYSFPHGPVPESVYQLLNGEKSDPTWSEHIDSHRPMAKLLKAPEPRHLSEAQRELAREVFAENESKSGMQLSKESHDLPEWKDPNRSSVPIEYGVLLHHLGKSNDEVEDIFERLSSEAALEDLLD